MTDSTPTTEPPKRKLTVRLTKDETWQALRDGHNGIFTSLRRDGVPVSMPVWYVVLDDTIYIGTRGKKLARVRHDSRASFLVEGGVYWRDLWGVHVTGTAEIIDPSPELAARIAAENARKYDAYRTPREEMPEEVRNTYETAEHAVVRITPDARILTWKNAKLWD
jgi:nitroimidazol reductase NimA-like FMN-containing flavoprotein (pyridoxamine 5'-phosphate oxidase superfamily)